MRILSTRLISEEVCRLLIEANYELSESLANRIKTCETTESNPLAKLLLSKLSENMDAAKKPTSFRIVIVRV